MGRDRGGVVTSAAMHPATNLARGAATGPGPMMGKRRPAAMARRTTGAEIAVSATSGRWMGKLVG
jgi:hypothetical protein